METEGAYGEVLKEDLVEFFVPNEKTLSDQLKKWFEKHQEMEFPALTDQFTTNQNGVGLTEKSCVG